ncbi:hypothetical protein GCM10009737_28860 [Nocardioides lentus]|uniref:LysM domain-containing protein n=1 Tax=Nocardioides lentus TaxID=338077 RepID=A0ABP5B117_9ACTN
MAHRPREAVRDAPASALRCLLVWLTCGAAAAGAARALGHDLAAAAATVGDGRLGTVPLEVLLSWTASVAALVALAWGWLVTGLVALGAARGRRSRVRGCPEALRRLVLGACGAGVAVGVLGGLVGPAVADSPPAPVPLGGVLSDGDPGSVPAGPVARPDLDGLPLPDRSPGPGHRASDDRPGPPDRPAEPAPPGAGPPAPPGGSWHRVAPGDSLWAIAESDLRAAGLPAHDAAVDRRWHAVHAANRDRLDDPDLIHPGQRLRLPGPAPTDPPDHHPGAPRP